MKFRIDKGTETFKKLVALHKRMLQADRAAYKLVGEIHKELGLASKGKKYRYASGQRKLAGGIAAICFDVKPTGWKMVGEPYQRLYFPKVTNKAILERIVALPVIEVEELNDLVGFKPRISIDGNGNMVDHRGPGMEWKSDVILMETSPGFKYTPPNGDIVEILESEYIRLQQGVQPKKKTKTPA